MQGLKTVRVLIEPQFAYRYYSELLDLFGLTLKDEKCRIEPGNQPWLNPVLEAGIPQLEEGDLLHHKFAVIDDKRVLFGSHNWSQAANQTNDETFMVIENTEIALKFKSEMNRLIKSAVLGVRPWLLKKIDDQEKLCTLALQK
jgi:phosphatidylserine/phosphatidylglycerophosphate/cardiolipin synthase-like enzyme